MNRRDALAALAAAGAFGLVGWAKSAADDPPPGEGAPTAQLRDGERQGGVALKTIGVLGGLGPQATMDFEARVHQVAQRLIPQRQNSGYPPMIVYYHRHPPILVNDDGSPQFPIRPHPNLLEGARQLGTLADFLVIAANGPHMIQDQIERAAGRKVLSMIEVTLKDVQRREWRKLGVLGFGDPTVYTTPLRAMKLAYDVIEGELRTKLDESIMRVMEGSDDAGSAAAAHDAVAYLRGKGVDGIILGCTELPLLLGEAADGPDLVNPSQLLAEAAVRHAQA
jgi:aspartate racemase